MVPHDNISPVDTPYRYYKVSSAMQMKCLLPVTKSPLPVMTICVVGVIKSLPVKTFPQPVNVLTMRKQYIYTYLHSFLNIWHILVGPMW